MIRVNGNTVTDADGLTVAGFLEREGYRRERIAVERNGAILPKACYEAAILEDGDLLEVVSFVGGG